MVFAPYAIEILRIICSISKWIMERERLCKLNAVNIYTFVSPLYADFNED